MLITQRWTRYGHDRVYVTHPDGSKIGYLDLKTGTSEIELPEWAGEFNEAVAPYLSSPGESHDQADPPPSDGAGQSLRHEYDRRMAQREARVNARFPRVGRLLLAVFDEAPSTRAFKTGAEGERKAVKRILADGGDSTLLLVNRRLGQGRRDGDIDVLAITAAGVHVIDVKHYKDAKVKVESTGGLFSPRVEHLYVRGREPTKLIDKLEKQVAAVQEALSGITTMESVPVTAALCFVDAQLPLMSTPTIREVQCLGPKGTAKWLRESSGPLGENQRESVYELLDRKLPSAAG